MWMFLIDLLHSGFFDNLHRVGNVVSLLFVTDLYQFLLHIWNPILVMFHFLQVRIYIFCGISTVVFRVTSSGGVFLLNVSGSARFFPLSKLYVILGNSKKLIEIYKLYGLGLISV